MNREQGARDALAFVKRLDVPPANAAFDNAFDHPPRDLNGKATTP